MPRGRGISTIRNRTHRPLWDTLLMGLEPMAFFFPHSKGSLILKIRELSSMSLVGVRVTQVVRYLWLYESKVSQCSDTQRGI